jgi:putative inorganic carbon (hco3(-)) transporter
VVLYAWRVTEFAALSGPTPKAGVVVVALLAAWALLASEPRARATAMVGALVLSPVLLLADIWHSPQLSLVHRHPVYAAGGALIAVALIVVAGLLIVRWPALLGVLALIALPFRIPISAGGTTSNLLVPLYLVVASGAVAFIVVAWRDERELEPDAAAATVGARWVERLLALFVVLYAVQAIYSKDFQIALQQMVFFYVPFSLLFCMLRRLQWTRERLRTCLILVAALAVVFAAVGFVEYETKTLLLNPKLIAANNVHTYFTVNSVFFDPDIFGRFLALVMILVASILLYGQRPRDLIAATVVLAILWGGLVLTLSRSSLAALLVGLGTLAALRWKAWPAFVAAGVAVVLGAAAVAISPKTFGLNQGLNGASSGRAGLVSGGIDLFRERPVWGYGSGSFVREYRAHHRGTSTTLAASHTIPITIAAEQGLIGELAYAALVLVPLVGLLRGAAADPARVAVAAAFLALVFHTMLYADFLEDPATWTLLGVGTALAVAARAEEPVAGRRRPAVAVATA